VVFDEYHGACNYRTLLRLCDRTPCQVPVKGGFANWRPEFIIFTSSTPPDNWYQREPSLAELFRRVETVVEVGVGAMDDVLGVQATRYTDKFRVYNLNF